MFADFPSIVLWWLILLLFGIAAYPLTARLFSAFVDRGYAFTKVIGIVLVSYLLFFGANLKLVTLNQPTIAVLLVIVAAVSNYQRLLPGQQSGKLPWKIILAEEGLFFLGLWFWSVVRAFAPELHGLEKYMDFGFVNSILVGKSLPPLDMWLTQAPDYPHYFINYYYFGHFVTALLTRLSGIDAAVTYNLMIATIFAFTFTLSFSLGLNLFYLAMKQLKGAVIVGFVAAFLVTLGGNLHTIYLFTRGYANDNPVPFWQILSSYNPQTYWYPNATRFIPYTIHEFPLYSFVVSDLHGHVLDIPFVLTTLAILLSLITNENSKSEARNSKQIQKNLNDQNSKMFGIWNLKHFNLFRISNLGFRILLLGLLLAVMYMTNAWDGLIYFVLAGLVLLFKNYRASHTHIGNNENFKFQISNFKFENTNFLIKTLFQGAIILFLFALFSLPFSLHFKPFVSGFGVVCPPAYLSGKSFGPLIFEEGDKCARSPLWMLGILWGFFYYSILGFIVFVVRPQLRKKIENLHPTDVFVLLLIIISTLLLIFPEFLYAKDIYPLHYRANTMFKLGYQAFMMLQLVSAYTFFRILSVRTAVETSISKVTFALTELPKVLWIFGFFVGFFLVSVYPYYAILSYYGNLKYYKGLNGLAWFEQQYPDDYRGVQWLRTQIAREQLPTSPSTLLRASEQPVILEANGESYTDFARVSAYTGLPTVIGWPVHEWLWRGSYDEPGKRIPLVERMYTSTDLHEVQDLLRKYRISYVFVGVLERQKYPTLTEEVLKKLGEVVYTSGDTRIYRINQ